MIKIKKGTTLTTWFGKDSDIKVFVNGKQLNPRRHKQLVIAFEKDFDLSDRK